VGAAEVVKVTKEVERMMRIDIVGVAVAVAVIHGCPGGCDTSRGLKAHAM